ncbi:MAG: class I SAM-dependent methyltransferase [Nevskiales bacterium]
MSNPDQERQPFGSRGAVEYYESKRYKTSLQKRVDRRERSVLAELIERYAGRGGSALDVPCGYGRIVPILRALDYRLVLVDISDDMVNFVKERDDLGLGARAFQGDLLKGLTLGDGEMDLACSIRLFQHLHNPEWRIAALKELARVSKRWVILTFYDAGSVHWYSKQLLSKLKRKPVRVKMIPRDLFAQEARQAGLVVREFRPMLPRVHAQTFVVLEKAAMSQFAVTPAQAGVHVRGKTGFRLSPE